MSRSPVMLVGAGPGDPELVTLRAEELLGEAETVVTDAILGALVARFAPTADVVAVPPGRAAVDEVLGAATGRRVVRLYRGDPWLHPAYEDEREALERFGLAFEAVAGVALELALPALAGVPVHVRHLAVACTLGPYQAMPPGAPPARTLVASGEDPLTMVRAMAAAARGSQAAALVPVSDTGRSWRGSLADALGVATTMGGPALLVLGDVCHLPAAHPAPHAVRRTPRERKDRESGQPPPGPAAPSRPGPAPPPLETDADARSSAATGPGDPRRTAGQETAPAAGPASAPWTARVEAP